MFKTITTIMLTVVAVLFSIQNFDHVAVDIFFGKPVNIRLIFVILISAVAGYLIRHFIGIGREEKLKKQLQIIMKQKKFIKKRKKEDDLFVGEEIFDYDDL